jgi:hypothetical protein
MIYFIKRSSAGLQPPARFSDRHILSACGGPSSCIQFCEANGRFAGMLNAPELGAISDLAFARKYPDWLYGAEGGKLFVGRAKSREWRWALQESRPRLRCKQWTGADYEPT